MGLTFKYNGAAVTGKINLADGIDGFTTAANMGELGTAEVDIEDSAGSADYIGWKTFSADESACSVPRVWTGFITDRPIVRLSPGQGAMRTWRCALVDLNAVFGFRAITGSDGKRPAETDLARIGWILGSPYLSTWLTDAGLVDLTNNPANFGAADYRHRYPLDVFNDVAGVSGKQFFAYWSDGAGAPALFYDRAADAVHDSTLRISNDPADANSTTLAPMGDVEITRSPQDAYDGIDYGYMGASIYRRDTSGSPPTPTGGRDFVYQTDRVGKLATAESQAAAFLADHRVETDVVALTVAIPDSQINLLTEGMRLQLKLTHGPGYTSFVYTRVTRRIVSLETVNGRYVVKLDLTTKKRVAPTDSGGPGGGVVVVPHRGNPGLVQYKIGIGSITLDRVPTPGNLLLAFVARRSGSMGAGWSNGGDATDGVRFANMRYRTVVAGDAAGVWVVPNQGPTIIMEWEGVVFGSSVVQSNKPDTLTGYVDFGGAITPTAGVSVAIIGGAAIGTGDLDVTSFAPAAGWIELMDQKDATAGSPFGALVYQIVDKASGAYTPNGIATDTHANDTPFGGITVALESTTEALGPLPGQPRNNELVGYGNASTTTWTTRYPYAAGSLRVRVALANVYVVELDPEAGTFLLSPAAATGSEIRADYQGAP